ncbi:MAG: hypothetical protein K2M07_01835 [Muribaculaceae bacterium]|nr:hypothetical protein [Muribaculaceae bacterium]
MKKYSNRSVTEGCSFYGNFEADNKSFRLNTSTGYYDVTSGEHYQYLRNLQGSVMAVVNSRGETVQRTGLYPSGTPYILPCDYKSDGTNDMTPKTDRLHIGNHWMSQSGLNLYDNTARMHDPVLCDMKSGDPKFSEYPSMSHYSFCGANPANIIDPLGEDWYVDERGWLNWIESQEAFIEDKIKGYYLGETAVVVIGSRNETLGVKNGKSGYIDGEGAITATAYICGSEGADDVTSYTAFTMSSDYAKYGAIADGVYTLSYREYSGTGSIPKNYWLNYGKPVNCLDGKNPNPFDAYSTTQKNGIFVHRTNLDGFAGWHSEEKPVSSGCILIDTKQWDGFVKNLNKVMSKSGTSELLLFLGRY